MRLSIYIYFLHECFFALSNHPYNQYARLQLPLSSTCIYLNTKTYILFKVKGSFEYGVNFEICATTFIIITKVQQRTTHLPARYNGVGAVGISFLGVDSEKVTTRTTKISSPINVYQLNDDIL